MPDCFLDYASWRDNGFDGKRDPLEKRKLRMMEDNRKMKPLGGVKRGLPGQNIYGGSVSTAQALGGTGSMYRVYCEILRTLLSYFIIEDVSAI